MRFNNGSMSPRIIELHREGVAPREIARRVGCSHANVIRVLQRYTFWSGRVDTLPFEAQHWLVTEARRTRTTPEVMARAMLIDAINEAMEKSE